MADTKTTDLAELTTPAAGDILSAVDISDTGMAASGTNKKLTIANLTGWSGGGQIITQGTFNPAFANQGGTSITATYTVQNGRYVRIGPLMFIDLYLFTSAFSASGAGTLRIGGLPAVVSSTSNRNTAMTVAYARQFNGMTTTGRMLTAYTVPGTSQIELWETDTQSNSGVLDPTSASSTPDIMISGLYVTA